MKPLNNKSPILIVGGGGHAKVIAELINRLGREILGYVDQSESSLSEIGIQYLGNDQQGLALNTAGLAVTIGVGYLPGAVLRRNLFNTYSDAGFEIATLVHPSAIIADGVSIADGAQIMAGAIVQTGTEIGKNVIVNTGAIIDHDGDIGADCHIAPGACLCGHVSLARNVFVGSRATIIQEIDVAADTTIGAGAVITHNIMNTSFIKPAPVVITER